jgi:ankyrin repeat protein
MHDGNWTAPNPELAPPKKGEPALFRAARVGDHEAIRALAAGGADLNGEFDIQLDDGGPPCMVTPLMVAAGSGDGASVETVRLLLELGADAGKVTGGGSAAGFACRGLGWNYRPGGDAARLGAVLAAGSPLKLEGAAGARRLAEAASRGDAAMMRVLMERGASVNAVFGEEERQESARAMEEMGSHMGDPFAMLPDELKQDEGMMQALREAMDGIQGTLGESLSSGAWPYEIPLFAAAGSGEAECVRMLIEAGAEVSQRDNSGRTALFSAASAEVVRVLAAAGIDVGARDQYGRDAFRQHLEDVSAADEDRVEAVLRALLDAGAALQVEDEDGTDRMWKAAFSENPRAVAMLMKLGHPVSPGSRGQTGLHAICWHWDHGDERDDMTREMVRMFLAAGVSPNARDQSGTTPLHEAMTGDGVNTVAAEELIRAGADVNAVDEDGNTPLMTHYEVLFDYQRVVEFLLAHGANPLIRNKRGKSVIDLARQMMTGENPDWRAEQWADEGGPPCGWKAPADEGDDEAAALAMLEEAAKRFGNGDQA